MKHLLVNSYYRVFKIRRIRHRAQVFSLNSKLVIYTTLILLAVGTLVFYLTEYNNTLSEHQGSGKLIAEPDKFATDIIFEVFSAFSTVGLSRGITGDLSEAGKYIIVFTMFIGRVGALTILVAVIKKSTGKFIQYPSEGILIN
jgi:Trk-type K+ transport system membrane component